MFPGINSKQAKNMMKKMGIQQVDIPATEVIIKTPDQEIVITNPNVAKVNAMGQQTYQITGEEHIREKVTEVSFTADDIKTVMEQANCSEEQAKAALEETNDLAEAILNISSGEE